MATIALNDRNQYTIENLPAGFTYDPQNRQIHCHSLRTYSILNPDNSVTCPPSTYSNVNEYVSTQLKALKEQNLKEMRAHRWPDNLTYYEVNLMHHSKIILEKTDLIGIILIISGFVLTLILVPVLCNYLL